MSELDQLFEKACFIRAFEMAMADCADRGFVPGLLHLCCGAEVVEVALCSRLDGTRDKITGSHRSHGLALSMGADPYKVAAEILGLPEGLSGGKGGTQHLFAPGNGFLASNGIVGAQAPLAAGAALTAKMLGSGGIGTVFFGDGAANQGAVFETMNLAAALSLPLLFVLENNGLAQTMDTKKASGGVALGLRAEGFGLKLFLMNGFDAEQCLTVAAQAVSYIRETGQPALVEAAVPRLEGHYYGDGAAMQDADDPILQLAASIGKEKAAAVRVRVQHSLDHLIGSLLKERIV